MSDLQAFAQRQEALDIAQALIYLGMTVFLSHTIVCAKRAKRGALQIDHIHAAETIQTMISYFFAGVLFLVLRSVSLLLTAAFYRQDPYGAMDIQLVTKSGGFLIVSSYVTYSAASAIFYILRALIIVSWISILLPRRTLALQSFAFGSAVGLGIFLSIRTALMCAMRLTRNVIFSESKSISTSLAVVGLVWDLVTAVIFGTAVVIVTVAMRFHLDRRPNFLLDAAAKLSAASFVLGSLIFAFCDGPCMHDPNQQPAMWDRTMDGAAEFVAVVAEAVPTLILLIGLRLQWLKQYAHYCQRDSSAGLEMLAEAAWQMHLESAPPPMERRGDGGGRASGASGGEGGGGEMDEEWGARGGEERGVRGGGGEEESRNVRRARAEINNADEDDEAEEERGGGGIMEDENERMRLTDQDSLKQTRRK